MKNTALISGIEFYLPENKLGNHDVVSSQSKWTADDVERKTGVRYRHIASHGQTCSDMAVKAALQLFSSGKCKADDIDFILLCTQSPDYILPSTACVIQNRLGIPNSAGALDFNLGCSGYIYGLSLAKGLIESAQASNVLLLTSERYSQYIHEEDYNTRVIFGDGATATLVSKHKGLYLLKEFIFGTDGSGQNELIAHHHDRHLLMNGPEIFKFIMSAVPKALLQLLEKNHIQQNEIDYFVFHQANEYMLSNLRDILRIPKNQFYIDLKKYGNTVSSSIPIAIKELLNSNRIYEKTALMGFGVGYSWAGCIMESVH